MGDDDFVDKVIRTAELELTLTVPIPNLVSAICEHYKIDLPTLRALGKHRCVACVRSVLALLVRDTEDLRLEVMLQRSASGLSGQVVLLAAKKKLK
ncbi:MAG: hypothetical protein S4CHLAM123_08080 [Chlamydiales bacterium]|nr:hypothetical protein [Chlamydiales bacterium]